MKVHFAEGGSSQDEISRALNMESETWKPRRGPDWAELMARAEGVRVQRFLLSAAVVVAFVAVVGIAVVMTASHSLPGGLEPVRDWLLP
jgi:hypothetical protein